MIIKVLVRQNITLPLSKKLHLHLISVGERPVKIWYRVWDNTAGLVSSETSSRNRRPNVDILGVANIIRVGGRTLISCHSRGVGAKRPKAYENAWTGKGAILESYLLWYIFDNPGTGQFR